MIRSLRLKLLVGYAILLLALASAFGGLLYTYLRKAIEQEIDGELSHQAREVVKVIFPVENNHFYVELSREQVTYFSTDGSGAPHYSIWKANGELIDSSDPQLTIPAPRRTGIRDRERFRELVTRGPANTWLLVGKDVLRERRQLQHLAATAAGISGLAICLMFAGGWFLTDRALAPIARISQAASAISASNLSERIDVSKMETELASLAAMINDAFERLEQAFEQQARFTADASHELRTPLSIIISHAELALKAERCEQEYRQTLETIRRAALRMKGVVEGLLTLARAEAGGLSLRREKVDLQLVTDETCELLQPLADEKQLSIVRNLQPAMITGDRDRIAEAIANLLNNAIQYSDAGTRVEIILRASSKHVELSIADAGPGIPPEERSHIFERFYRIDRSRSQAIPGSGLGLAIAKWIVDAHGGSITCAPGQSIGTVFTIRLVRT